MHPELNHLVANEHIADLRLAAERDRLARFLKRESFLAQAITRVRSRGRPADHRAPGQLRDAKATTAAIDAATAEA